MDEHFSGNGAKVTQKFKPINGEVIDTYPGYFANKLEQKYTNANIDKYGYDNVRGGKYVNSKTLKNNSITCYKCGKYGHYANSCDYDDSSDYDDY